MVVLARIEPIAEARRSSRRRLRLSTSARLGPREHSVNVHDLSDTGLLMETSDTIRIGDEIVVDLPTSRGTLARVMWNSHSFYGCQFVDPSSRAVTSAAFPPGDVAEPPLAPANAEETEPPDWEAEERSSAAHRRLGLVTIIVTGGLLLAIGADQLPVGRPGAVACLQRWAAG